MRANISVTQTITAIHPSKHSCTYELHTISIINISDYHSTDISSYHSLQLTIQTHKNRESQNQVSFRDVRFCCSAYCSSIAHTSKIQILCPFFLQSTKEKINSQEAQRQFIIQTTTRGGPKYIHLKILKAQVSHEEADMHLGE